MRQAVGRKTNQTDSSVKSLLRGIGRIGIWTVLGLLLIRGIVAGPAPSAPRPERSTAAPGPKEAAFAVRLARAYLADPSAAALAPFLAEGAVALGGGRPPRPGGSDLAQAEVSGFQELGDGRSILTVACDLRDTRTLYLAVPIARSEAGEVAALGAPSIVAEPGGTGVASPERPQSLAGPDATAIRGLVAKFLPGYLGARDPRDLSYFLAPGARVEPLGGQVGLVAITEVRQLGAAEGPRREVLVAARISDAASGAVYPLTYRLDLVRSGRWYVEAVAGASA
ncbi:MAG TPA: conjugal transfer protein [Solirubrobacterales bacterium]|nr:conjugal transfer protein [Solirubrobacterales bacterium]